LDTFERVYYIRALMGLVAGVVAGFVMPFASHSPPVEQNVSVSIAFAIAIVFYFISLGVAKGLVKNVPKDKGRKVATEGIIPFIFLQLVSMIIVYTALHQSILLG
jgi:hypothetical protein